MWPYYLIAVIAVVYLLSLGMTPTARAESAETPPTHTYWNGQVVSPADIAVSSLRPAIFDHSIDPDIVDNTASTQPPYFDDEFLRNLRSPGATFQIGRRSQLLSDDLTAVAQDRTRMLTGGCTVAGSKYATSVGSAFDILYTERGMKSPPPSAPMLEYRNPDGRRYLESSPWPAPPGKPAR